jgi:hypothetical protein
MRERRVSLLLGLLDQAFDHRAWHGTNLKGSIRGLSARDASWRPSRARHNIWEIVVHAAYWKYAVRRRLTGQKRGSFPLAGSNWFARSGGDEHAWRADVQLLNREHAALRRAIAAVPPGALSRRAAGGTTTNVVLITGIAAHDLYHAGQIQLLKKLRRSR